MTDLATAPTAVTAALSRTVNAPTRRPPLLKGGLAAADLAAVGIGMLAASSLHQILPAEQVQATTRQFHISVLSLPIWLAFFVHYRLYNARYLSSRLTEFRRIVHSAGASVMAIAAMTLALRLYVPRSWLLMTFLVSVISLTAERDLVRRAFKAQRRRGKCLRPVLIVGANREGRDIALMIRESSGLHYRVVGFVDDDLPAGAMVEGIPVVGDVASTARLAREHEATGVLIAATAFGLQTSSQMAFELTNANLHVELCSGLCDVAAERLTVQNLGRLSVLYIEPVRLDGWRGGAKRAFDVIGATVGLVVFTPILLVATVAIKLDSRGPALFRQHRVGKNGKSFQIVKMRTMVRDAEAKLDELRAHNEADGPLFKMARDPRITRVGRRLRTLSIDEIPQLWNVLRGEMSLVGPRPALPDEVHGWSPELHERLQVRPGVTGMWQVSGRTLASFDDYTRLDLYYVRNWSLLTDLAMLAKTVPTVLSRRGAC